MIMSRAERLAILCFYEKDGFVDTYVYHLVEELISVSDKVIIAVNGKIEEKAKVYFEKRHCSCIPLVNPGCRDISGEEST